MQPILALDMDEATAWTVIIAGTLSAIAAAVVSIIIAIQNARAKIAAEKSEVKIDQTLSNTNGKIHGMTREVAALKKEVQSLKSQNTNLRHEVKAKAKRKVSTR